MPLNMPTNIDFLITFYAYVAVAGLMLIGLVVFGIILSKISSGKFVKSCKTISDFANETGTIDDGNLEQFEATCLDETTNPAFLEGWEAFKAARFGYPSEYVDKAAVLDKFNAKKFKLGVLIYSLVLFVIDAAVAAYAILTTRDVYQYSLVVALCSLLVPLIPLAAYLPLKPAKKAEVAYDQMIDDVDTAVKLQRLVERKVDNSRLTAIQEVIKDVILAEQSKPIPSKKDQLARRAALENAPEVEDESLDDIRDELFGDDEPVAEYAADAVDAPVPEFTVDEQVAEPEPEPEPVAEPVAEEVVEEPAPEPVEEAPAPKKPIPFKPFVGILDDAIENGNYPKETLKKMANILVLAFGKFKEPEQREALKGSIRKFLVAYKAAVAAEAAAEETQYAEEEYVAEAAAEEEIAEEEIAEEEVAEEAYAEEEVVEEAAPAEEYVQEITVEIPDEIPVAPAHYVDFDEDQMRDETPSYSEFAPKVPGENRVKLSSSDDIPELPD